MANDSKVSVKAHCLCGRIQFRVTSAPVMTAACHCRGCQRLSASAYSLTAMIPSGDFAVTQGEPVVGALHGEHRHYFCSYCMSWLFTRPNGMDQFVNIRPTMLEDVSWSEPFIETYTCEKLPWVRTPAVHSFEKWPPMTDVGALMAEFAKTRASALVRGIQTAQ